MIAAQEGVPGALAPEERRRISTRLISGLVGIGLLALGTLLVHLVPDQWQIGELCRGLAAAVVGVPTLISGIRGVLTGDTRRATDQLVAIAVLAAAASGDFVTATLISLFLELGRLFEERSSLGARAAHRWHPRVRSTAGSEMAQQNRGAGRSEQSHAGG
jgi:cation transport ATPase